MKSVKVFYRPEQTVIENQSFSPSAGKPAQVLQSWIDQGFPIEVMSFKPLKPSQIALAHDAGFVRRILARQEANGFGNTSAEVAASLPYTSGSFVAAALHALKTGETCASLTSGFHHANYASSGGFCTFNGLMIAAQALRLHGATNVGILDCDAHYGNGTDNIIRKLGLEDEITHWTFGEQNITKDNAEEWLKELPKIVSRFAECDVLLYQAGADPHVDDPLGGSLTTEQMRRRDEIVFAVCKRLKIPVAWNLAGGYQSPLRKVLDLHDATMQCCVNSYLTEKGQKHVADSGKERSNQGQRNGEAYE